MRSCGTLRRVAACAPQLKRYVFGDNHGKRSKKPSTLGRKRQLALIEDERYAKHESNRKRREDGKVLASGKIMDELDDYHYHEALDKTYILLKNLENALEDHPVLLVDKKLMELYDNEVENLA